MSRPVSTEKALFAGFVTVEGSLYFVGGHHRICYHLIIRYGRRVAVHSWQLGCGRGIFHDCDLEALLEQIPQVTLNTEVSRHARKDHFRDSALAELKHEVVRLRPVNLVWAGNDRVAVVNVRLILWHPVSPGVLKTFQGQWSFAIKHSNLVHEHLEWPAGFPFVIPGVVIVGRNEYWDVVCLCKFEERLDVFNGMVGLDALAHDSPCDALWAEEVDLGIDHDECGVSAIKLDGGLGELRVGSGCSEHEPDGYGGCSKCLLQVIHC